MSIRRSVGRDLQRDIEAWARGDHSLSKQRRLAAACRAVLRTYRSTMEKGDDNAQRSQRRDARLALLHLGGEPEPQSRSLRDYDHLRFGPFLGVSDEGSAAKAILAGALRSPKAMALGIHDPFALGVALDAERLGAVGEVPVGPEEYSDVWLGCVEQLLMTTNVGTRVNPRMYLRPPVVTFEEGPDAASAKTAAERVDERCRPFARTPDGKPRPLTLYLSFSRVSNRSERRRQAIVQAVRSELRQARHFQKGVHQLGVGVRIDPGEKGREQAIAAVDLAKATGCKDVLVIGRVRPRADEQGSLPGLLQYLPIAATQAVLAHARARHIKIRAANGIDPDTIARSLWTNLRTARSMGMHLGKYGTFPLTLADCDSVVGQVQSWFPDWSAAPALFIDQPIVDSGHVYSARSRVAGIEAWLRIVARHKVPIVLIDTVDKSKGWRLLRIRGSTKGLLSIDEVKRLDRFALSLGIRVLWAGGISLPEAYEMGKLRPFGIYVTSAASAAVAVSGSYINDPMLSALKKPTKAGVLRAKLMLEAGFLAASLRDRDLAIEIEQRAQSFTATLDASDTPERRRIEHALIDAVARSWRARRRESRHPAA